MAKNKLPRWELELTPEDEEVLSQLEILTGSKTKASITRLAWRELLKKLKKGADT